MAGRGKQTLRIIGGQWRGRKFNFPAVEHLRPTPDRVRETLFNWLMPIIKGATCLDLFCGSGALGLESLSRGASQVTFVDKNKQVIDILKETCVQVKTSQAEFYLGDVQSYLNTLAEPKHSETIDLAFIDPPYDLKLQAQLAHLLESTGCLKSSAWIYIEHDGQLDEQTLPVGWNKHREKVAGAVHYALYKNN